MYAALRRLARQPGSSATVAMTLALAIGATSAIFSAVDAVLLKPLPFPSADRLVAVYERNGALRQATQLVAPGRLEEWNARNHTFDGLAASYFENMTDTTGALPERVAAMRTSPRFFAVLAVPPAIGRTPTPDEERFGGPPVAIVSNTFWRNRLNSDPSAAGRRLILGGVAYAIVGVMPPSFRYPTDSTEVWLPTRAPMTFLQARTARLYTAFGRMKPGVTIEQAQADLDSVQAQLGEEFPQTDRGWGSALVPVKEERIAGVRRSLWLLLGAVVLVLLAACGNVACLMLAAAVRREQEIAIRFALGARRGTVIGQLLLEGAMLASAGAAAGLVVAYWGVAALRVAAAELPRIAEVHLDARLVVLTFVVGVATTLLFALAPALRATRTDAADALARGGRGHIAGRHQVQRILVAGQIALAIILLVGAGLLIRSFDRMQRVSPGFDPDNVLTFRMSAQWSERADAVVQRHARTIARLMAIPGVESAAFSQHFPAGITIPPGEFTVIGRDAAEKTFATGRAVSAGYFRTLRIPILKGDTCSDDPATPPYSKALVTRAFAEKFFGGETPIGHALTTPNLVGRRADVVGIVGDVSENGILSGAEPVIYWCTYNPYWPDPFFLVRTTASHAAPIAAIRAALREIEPQRAVYAVRPLTDLVAASTSQRRINAILLALFAATALLLAAIGLYGVLSQVVASRRREIGVRVALGARAGQIVALVARQAAAMTALGIATGLGGAFAVARLMGTLVFGISPRDPLTFLAVPVVLAAVAAVTAYVPARRAARLDPVHALRVD
jgi:putative ABC transport system permease protein